MRSLNDTGLGSRWVMRLAILEMLLGVLILYWDFSRGVHDQSSLGEVFFFWSALAAIFCFLIPGLLLLVRHPVRWVLQPLPALLLVLVVTFYTRGLMTK